MAFLSSKSFRGFSFYKQNLSFSFLQLLFFIDKPFPRLHPVEPVEPIFIQKKTFQKIDIDDEEDQTKSHETDLDEENSNDLQPPNLKLTAEQILNNLETDETKVLSNDQLKRYVLLQQVRVLTLQQKRLEHLNNIHDGKDITIDFIGFEEEIESVNPSVTKT